MEDVMGSKTAEELQIEWDSDPRWQGVERPYSPEDVIRLRGVIQEEHTLARHGAETGGDADVHWLAPIVADAEAGFGGVLNAFELMKAMIDAGASGVHFEDQLSSAKKCGHMGGKVLVPTQEAVNKLVAARLAADVCGVPTVLVARTDAESATLLTSDVDERDHAFIASRERTAEGFFAAKAGIPQANDVLGRIGPLDVLPSRVGLPLSPQLVRGSLEAIVHVTLLGRPLGPDSSLCSARGHPQGDLPRRMDIFLRMSILAGIVM
jgi:hypothetical protein